MSGLVCRSAALTVATLLALLPTARADAAQADEFPQPVNTERGAPPAPEQSLGMMKLPRGFEATVFAAEPAVQQPIAMTFDDRGRLWVAENYTYAERAVNFSAEHRDRIVILADTDHDGRCDRRTVFWDLGNKLTSVEIGFGGVWVLCAPRLLFIPDRNGDDVPDSEPIVVLDGWEDNAIRHNLVNGLRWGPDGWLYGRHGIQATSFVGRPGTPREQRTALNCSIWRYHPTHETFEVVAHGTTNPWGLDFDDHGEMFFINTVIGHLFHVIPGAHYKRMYGEDLNLHVYELIDQHADHYHWDTGKQWHETREATGLTDRLGGGHAHSGLMIYLGDNWPDRYRNTLFTVNLHGRRINNDLLVRSGSGYVGKHGDDFLKTDDPWFRGIELVYGPDGGVYIADWSDIGECHENDGVHRTSGRIYKVTFGKPKPPASGDVSKLSDGELVRMQLHKNDWYVRAARRNLQERATAGRDMSAAHAELREMFVKNGDVTRKLRAMWALHLTGGATEAWLRQQLGHEDEHVRAWAVRLLVDLGRVSPETLDEFIGLATTDPSGLLRLSLASALQRLPAADRSALAARLGGHNADSTDHNLPLMLWYGIEPLVATEPWTSVKLAQSSRMPLVRRFIARRLTEDVEQQPGPVNTLLQLAAGRSSPQFDLDVLQGMSDALRGWRKARPPEAWAAVQKKLARSPNADVRERVRELSVVFGDGRALDDLRQVVLLPSADAEARRAALRVLIDSRADGLLHALPKLVADRATAGLAARGLAALDHPDTPKLVIQNYQMIRPEERPGAINALVSRPAYAEALLRAAADGRVPRGDISAFHARQIRSFDDDRLGELLSEVWGEIRNTPEEKQQLIASFKRSLSADRLAAANLPQGRALFNKTCAACHRLYGEGGTIGADLTGSNRDNIDYLLENILDPSALVPAEFRMSVVGLKDGRVITGVVGEQTPRTLAVQTQTERLRLDRSEIDEIRGTPLSLMPDGLLTGLSDEQVCDLVGYLMSRQQVPLPAN